MSGSLQDELKNIRWFHRIDLGNGVVTPGVDDTAAKLQRVQLPARLDGRSLLDVGAWDGFFAFEAERRGAARVVALDSYSWDGGGWGTKAGFDLAHRHLNSSVQTLCLEIDEISPQTTGVFDDVLFLGVLYHLPDPLAALRAIAQVTRDRLILETVVGLLHVRSPAMAFFAATQLNNDPTNWWAPNVSGLIAMLQSVGFSGIEIVSPPKPWWKRILRRPARSETWWQAVCRDRVVIHARKPASVSNGYPQA